MSGLLVEEGSRESLSGRQFSVRSVANPLSKKRDVALKEPSLHDSLGSFGSGVSLSLVLVHVPSIRR